MNKLKIENSHLVRDSYSNALLSTNKEALNEYKVRKKKKEEEQAKLAEIDSLKEDLQELKTLVAELLNQRDNA
jgi:hypothetical protein